MEDFCKTIRKGGIMKIYDVLLGETPLDESHVKDIMSYSILSAVNENCYQTLNGSVDLDSLSNDIAVYFSGFKGIIRFTYQGAQHECIDILQLVGPVGENLSLNNLRQKSTALVVGFRYEDEANFEYLVKSVKDYYGNKGVNIYILGNGQFDKIISENIYGAELETKLNIDVFVNNTFAKGGRDEEASKD